MRTDEWASTHLRYSTHEGDPDLSQYFLSVSRIVLSKFSDWPGVEANVPPRSCVAGGLKPATDTSDTGCGREYDSLADAISIPHSG